MDKRVKFLAVFICLMVTQALFAACPFCNPAVIEKQAVYENELYYVLVDYAPVLPGHLLAVPKRHVVKANELTQAEWGALSDVVPRVVKVFQKNFNTDQYIILEKNGPFAGQTVPHVHFHLIPIPTQKMADAAKTALYNKIFNMLPQKMGQEALQVEVERLKASFKETQ